MVKHEPKSDPVRWPGRDPLAALLTSLDLVDLGEIAARLNLGEKTPGAWRNRGQLPAPDLPGRAPYWFWATVEEWLARTGRDNPYGPSRAPQVVLTDTP